MTVSEKVFEREPNALGTIKSVTDENGAVTRYQYDWDGRLMLVDYGGGDVVKSEAGYAGEPSAYSFGKVVASSANGPRLNHVVQVIEHDRLLRPTKSESADGISVVEAYDLAGRVVTRNDQAAGLTEHFEYQDVLGRLTLQARTVLSKDEDGKDVVLSWSQRRVYADGAERTVEIVEAAGADGASETPIKTTKLVLDAAGRIWKRIEKIPGRADAVHQHAYDSAGRLTQYADPENRTKRWTFDGAGNLTQLVDELGYVTRYEREPGGAVLKQFGPGPASQPPVIVENGYDGFGRLVSRTLSGDSRGVPTSTWRYEPYYAMTGSDGAEGTVVETDPAGITTTRHYNGRGKVLREVRRDGTKSLELELAYDGEWAERQSRTETNGSSGSWSTVTERTFDDRGRVRLEKESWEATPADGGEMLSHVYTTSSRWAGRVAQVTEQWATGADSGRRDWRVEVDGLGNAIATGSVSPAIEDRWGYDASGALVWEKAAGKPKRVMQYVEGLLATSTYGQENTTYDYWPTGKLKSINGPDGRTRTYTWDARGQLQLENYGNTELSTSTRYSYDARGKIASITYGDGTADANQWQYGNAATGELVSVSLPGQLGSFGYEYDGNRRLKAIKRPTGGAPDETFTYDFLGRLAQRTRGMAKWSTTWAAGEGTTTSPVEDTVRTLLDARGRIAREKYIPGSESVSGGLFEVTRRYGPRDELLRAVEKTAGGQQTANVFRYDGRGRLTSIARGNATVSYGYEPASDEVSRVESPGGAVSYRYDQRRRLEGITSQRGDTTFSWEPGGERLKLVRDAHTYEKWCYDGAGRVQSVVSDTQEFNCVALPAHAMAAFEYWYDGRGNRVLESRILQGTSDVREYVYDAADRLVGTRNGDRSAELLKLSGDGTRTGLKRYVSFEAGLKDYKTPGETEQHTYEYDARGGLKKVTVESQLDPKVDAQYTTDSAGRVKNEQWGSVVRDYGWDAAGRLVSVTKTDGPETTTLAYSYDWSGRRVSKTGPGAATTRFVWGANELLAEETGGSLRRYEQAAGMVIGVGTERVLHDGHGSAVGRVGASGSVSALYRYDAWGQLQGTSGPGSTDPSIAYAGQHWNADAGLSYAQQRWYDSRTGRFLSEDSVFGDLENPMSLHPFIYANGNPLRYTDPTGERAPTPEEAGYIGYLRNSISREKAKRWIERRSSGLIALQLYLDRYTKAIGEALEGQDIDRRVDGGLPVRVAYNGLTSDPSEGIEVETAVTFKPKITGLERGILEHPFVVPPSPQSGLATAHDARTESIFSSPAAISYGQLSRQNSPGDQAHHLNQQAAYPDIPQNQGLATSVRGDAVQEPGSEHNTIHQNLETFWAAYRRGGALFGQRPTNAEYGSALYQALRAAGHGHSAATALADAAKAERLRYGLSESDPVPRIPQPVPQALSRGPSMRVNLMEPVPGGSLRPTAPSMRVNLLRGALPVGPVRAPAPVLPRPTR